MLKKKFNRYVYLWTFQLKMGMTFKTKFQNLQESSEKLLTKKCGKFNCQLKHPDFAPLSSPQFHSSFLHLPNCYYWHWLKANLFKSIPTSSEYRQYLVTENRNPDNYATKKITQPKGGKKMLVKSKMYIPNHLSHTSGRIILRFL